MEKMLVLLLSFLFSKPLLAQVTATAAATASATILHSVGTAEILDSATNRTAVFKTEDSFQNTEKSKTSPAMTVDFAAFRVVGREFVYSLSFVLNLPQPAINQKVQKKPLEGIHVKLSRETNEAYVLSSLVDVSAARQGGYREETVYHITINFN